MYKSHFDGYRNGSARGWIVDIEKPTCSVRLGLYTNKQLVKTFMANRYREDLAIAKIGDGCCAFEVTFDNSKAFEIEIRVLADGTLVKGSRRLFQTGDEYTDRVLRSLHFSEYDQFKPQNLTLNGTPLQYGKRSSRLTNGFSKIVAEHGGVKYSAHMEWMCSRHRRGSPSFFSRIRRNPLDDLYWYFFECTETSKAIAEYDFENLDLPVFPNFSGLEHHTLLFNLWLHRTGRKLDDIRIDGLKAHFDFCIALVSAGSNLPVDTGLSYGSEYPLLADNNNLNENLPQLTAYFYKKWMEGYKHLYRFDQLDGYILFLFDCCLHARNLREVELLGTSVKSFFSAPVAVGLGVVSRFSLICYALAHAAQNGSDADLTHTTAEQISDWFSETWLSIYPQHNDLKLLGMLDVAIVLEKYCYIVAHWDSPSGLTQNAHMSARALSECGVPVVMILPNGKIYDRLDILEQSDNCKLLKSFVILHVNADEAPAALYSISQSINLDQVLIVGYFLWELEVVPEAHKLGLSLVDEIWVPTEYVQKLYQSVCESSIVKIGKAITVPEIANPNRMKFGLREDALVFLISFDFGSSIERKNPLAAVKAFLGAFAERDDVLLVLKTTSYQPEHWGDPFDQWGQILDLVANERRIKIIDQFLSEGDMFELIACSDVIVSPHRAEGFGYVPAYGLLYRKSVVVTGYSGTCDYCDENNAWIVKYQLTAVPNERFVYHVPDARWAEIDAIDLRRCLLQAATDARKKEPSRFSRETLKRQSVDQLEANFSYSRLKNTMLKRLRVLKLIKKNLKSPT